jgi:hypothetical protein
MPDRILEDAPLRQKIHNRDLTKIIFPVEFLNGKEFTGAQHHRRIAALTIAKCGDKRAPSVRRFPSGRRLGHAVWP